ncbi:arabinosylfuranosidase ArfA [Actinoplanes xinjiangensis]|uniref:non-reducing end alpha-L-arabinofuranosidase n=1 Tax=Actinoplanes xinjiangensis TaxID=512350 RepID=A0A316G1G4_9ACTN|nr:alpha-N-arabinofuranosidase [Actinoplanes xinjiangensis]PWK48207.1 alpha-N-arabinofuranosidase [Actinoplanes xinjiangensis]GIF39040.1 alpha-N-arabinofuranosidase [Actinoplanes xinjiangensis]
MTRAHLTLHPAFPVGPIDRRLFGGFVEHLGRHVYDGIHEPGHPTAGPDGFRRDVIELVKELGVTTIRYPGGNFVSGYQWEDGVGPVDGRPRRLDLAWHSTETNRVGLHEFHDWLDLVGSELMLAVNLGTRGVKEAVDLLEYANVPSGTTRSDQRRANGREEPFGVTMWCLGNEMDGPWQVGHRSADDYGRLASQVAKAMRLVDTRLTLVVCGSSNRDMPTFGTWERTVLEHTWDDVDYISCHAYYQEHDGDLAGFLASGTDMDAFIDAVVATIDHVRAVKRSDKRIDISFDEWNVWYFTRWNEQEGTFAIDDWPVAPRLLEDVYTVADAVTVGGLLISLLNHADRVTSASLAQLVNVIAPIMTEPGGPAWRQTTFHPFALTSKAARGTALKVTLDADTVPTARYGDVPAVAAAATTEDGTVQLFLQNRDTTTPATVTVDLSGFPALSSATATGIWDDDPYAANTRDDPARVVPRANDTAALTGGVLTVTLPPVSWTAISVA